MDQLLQHLLNGLLLGATYSLLGIGLTLVFGLMNVVNFAHGEFYTLGAYAAFAALTVASVDFFLAIPLAIVVGAAAGAVCERGLLRPLRGQSIDTVMLVMIGLYSLGVRAGMPITSLVGAFGGSLALAMSVLWVYRVRSRVRPAPAT